MATGNHPSDGNDEMTFNVHVAKQMTVPDEIMLTGPIGRPSSSESPSASQMDPPRMIIPDDITFMDTLGGKNDSIGGVLRKAEQERKNTSSLAEVGEDQGKDKLAELQSQITSLNNRVTIIENRYPFVSTERNILNTFMFVTWLSLPVLFLVYYHKYMRQ